jgi:hypothetical protein
VNVCHEVPVKVCRKVPVCVECPAPVCKPAPCCPTTCCDTCGDTCGKSSWFSRLFAKRCGHNECDCCDSGCGCGTPAAGAVVAPAQQAKPENLPMPKGK